MQSPRISRAKAIDDYTLLVESSNEELRKYEFHRLLAISTFAPLKNPALFKNFAVEPGGYALVWNEDINVSEHELWEKGIHVEGNYDSFGSTATAAGSAASA